MEPDRDEPLLDGLDRLPPDAFEEPEEAPELFDRILARTTGVIRRRRRVRTVLALAAAVLIYVAGAATGRLLVPQTKDTSRENALAELERMLDEVRIAADVEIVDVKDSRTIVGQSAGSSVVFLPMALSDEGPTTVYGTPEDLLPELGLTALVLNERCPPREHSSAPTPMSSNEQPPS